MNDVMLSTKHSGKVLVFSELAHSSLHHIMIIAVTSGKSGHLHSVNGEGNIIC